MPPAGGVLGVGDEVGSAGSRDEGWSEHGDEEVVQGIVKEEAVVEM